MNTHTGFTGIALMIVAVILAIGFFAAGVPCAGLPLGLVIGLAGGGALASFFLSYVNFPD